MHRQGKLLGAHAWGQCRGRKITAQDLTAILHVSEATHEGVSASQKVPSQSRDTDPGETPLPAAVGGTQERSG